MTPDERRVTDLIEGSWEIVRAGVQRMVTDEGKQLAATVLLFSGGNDSTTMAHIFQEHSDYAAHINTGIGIERTRQFVRDTCAGWGLPLIEKSPPPGSTYLDLVTAQGFPGPAHHYKMYQRLKERALRMVRNELISEPRQERVVFLAGRRRDESKRRMNVPELERVGSVVWISPMVHWSALDLSQYRMMFDVPHNEVADLIHMSGECLCGAFAKKDELKEIGFWFPEVLEEIKALEDAVQALGIPEPMCHWGWGAYRDDIRRSKSGPMCSSCVVR